MKLLEPIRIGRIEFRNRIVLPPVDTCLATDEGIVTERLKKWWGERSRDVGLAVIGAVYIRKEGQLFTHSTAIHGDKCIPGLKELAQAIHDGGARAGVQIYHGGRECQPKITGEQHVAFYDYGSRLSPELPKILTYEDIEQLEEDFAAAALRAKEAGFDVVEFHATHGVGLFEQSLSPAMNKRTDKYGGDLEGRVRFTVETVEHVKKVVEDLVVIFRMGGEQNYPGGSFRDGYSLDDAKEIAKRVEKAGADVISVTIGPPGFFFVTTGYLERGFMVYLAEGIKRVVNVPVITAGRIDSLELANRIIEGGRADLVGMARPLIADPEFVRKSVEGRTDDITPCVACNECIERVGLDLDIHCLVNPACGREEEAVIIPAEKPKKVLIAGGGPAGMEAAIIAKRKGHEVVLYEKSDKLGGQLQVASKGPGKQEFDNLIWYFANQMCKLGVKVELEKEVTLALVRKMRPDVVIVATGATPVIPDIPGVQKGNVICANDVLSGAATVVGKRVVVVGGGFVGVELTDFLRARGKEVTLIEMLPRIGWDIGAVTLRATLYRRMRDNGVRLLSNTKLEEITEEGAVVTSDGKREVLEADCIVLAMGSESRKELAQQLEGKVSAVHVIGDCVESRKALEAIREGWQAALTI